MKLSKETMKALGFTAILPSGNPKEPWWQNDLLDITFYGRPTGKQFINELTSRAREDGENSVRNSIKNILKLH